MSTHFLNAQSIVINSYFNAGSPENEWTELIVVQDDLDLRNWELRDYNASQDIWQDPIIFKNISYWQHLRAGTIIVINHRAASFPDYLKSDGFIRVNANNTDYFTGNNFGNNALSINGPGDQVEIKFNGTHIHSLGHGVSPGSSFDDLPHPKLNHPSSLSNNQAVMVFPGSNVTEFDSAPNGDFF